MNPTINKEFQEQFDNWMKSDQANEWERIEDLSLMVEIGYQQHVHIKYLASSAKAYIVACTQLIEPKRLILISECIFARIGHHYCFFQTNEGVTFFENKVDF